MTKTERQRRNEARKTVRLSKTSKLGTLSWSLQAGATCPGSFKPDGSGDLVDACTGCYAKGGNYRYPNVREPREFNRRDWRRHDWVSRMTDALIGETHFRWFDSGDVYSAELARKIEQVIKLTPWCDHWIPTRMHKFSKTERVLRRIEKLPNAIVRRSSDSVQGEFNAKHGSTIYPHDAEAPADTFACPAYSNEGKCGDCRACYDPAVKVIAYKAHGRSMTSLVNRMRAA